VEKLWVAYNALTTLNLAGCMVLKYLICDNNQLTSLDVIDRAALTYLDCGINPLTSLNVSGCTELIRLLCNESQLAAAVLNTVFTALPDRSGASYASTVFIADNPGTATCDKTIAQNKNWTVNTTD
jgi:Leucine-rich repeat (LRR) protein